MKVLVTRPEAAAVGLAAELAARGHEPVLAPLLDIVPLDFALAAKTMESIAAIAITSSNAVPALAHYAGALGGRVDTPVFAVGAATAEAVSAAGFGEVRAASGDVESLSQLIENTCRPADGAVLYMAGVHRAGDLEGRLAAAGFEVEVVPVYDARPRSEFPTAAQAALEKGEIGAALFFSARSARTFCTLIGDSPSAALLKNVRAIAISENVAGCLGGLPWARLDVAPGRSEEAVLAALDAGDSIG